jgi:hypothetical protein
MSIPNDLSVGLSQSEGSGIVPDLHEHDKDRRKSATDAKHTLTTYKTQLEELERLCGSSFTSEDAPPPLPPVVPVPVPVPADDSAVSELSQSDSFEELPHVSLLSAKRQVYRQPFSELNLSRTKYIDYLERFGEGKCKEAEKLITRLLDHRAKALEVQKRLAEFQELKTQNAQLEAENERLRTQYNEIQTKVTRYVIRHREMKAETKTQQLQRLASIRKETETHDIEFYGFVLSQLKQYIDGNYDVDEESVRKLITRVAMLLRSASRTGDTGSSTSSFA